ncbi:MAG TPA: alpha-L-fucosidase [Cyclobacteriaceae bacterium]
MKHRGNYILVLLCALSLNLFSQPNETKVQQWKDLKYSMFIHYGIYSVLGGVWDGKPVTRGLSEQIQAHAGIYSDTYAAVAKQFNPLAWNADSIALLAKRSGMNSIVITSKHHDGFCMFHSAYTDFNVVDATPFKRDIVKELSDACKRHGLKFGLYFSLIDWHFPQASPISSHNSDYITPEHHEYNKKQVTELLTNYGSISELWFDMGSQSAEQSKELSNIVHTLQPDCLVSSRIGNDMGDFTVMGDNLEPDYSIGVPWQSPASFFDETWGYRSWQQRGREDDKVKEKLASLIRVVSRGGNYLLNIGPKGDGSTVDFEKNVLLKIGIWLKKNGAAIYSTQPDPFHQSFDWGNITTSANKMYLIVRANPNDETISLPGLKGSIANVYTLADKAKATFSSNTSGATVHLPKGFNVSEEFKVVVIEFKKGFTVEPGNIVKENNHKIILNSDNAFKFYSNSCIDYNTRFRSTVKESWTITSQATNTFTPELYYSAEEKGKEISIEINHIEQTVRLEGDETLSLKNDPASIQWTNVYKLGPIETGFEGADGDLTNINTNNYWPANTNNKWELQSNWQSNKSYSLPADAMISYYLLQEINTKNDQLVLAEITSGDGVIVFLNGKELLIHLNAAKTATQHDVVFLPLKKGKNQLVVKLFNNFHKEITVALGQCAEQVMYSKKLKPVELKANTLYPVSWKLKNPLTPHQHMLTPNLSLTFSSR